MYCVGVPECAVAVAEQHRHRARLGAFGRKLRAADVNADVGDDEVQFAVAVDVGDVHAPRILAGRDAPGRLEGAIAVAQEDVDVVVVIRHDRVELAIAVEVRDHHVLGVQRIAARHAGAGVVTAERERAVAVAQQDGQLGRAVVVPVPCPSAIARSSLPSPLKSPIVDQRE